MAGTEELIDPAADEKRLNDIVRSLNAFANMGRSFTLHETIFNELWALPFDARHHVINKIHGLVCKSLTAYNEAAELTKRAVSEQRRAAARNQQPDFRHLGIG